MDEQWKSVPGWEGFYDVSSVGRVRVSFDFAAGRPKRRGCIKKCKTKANGYQSVDLSKNSKRKYVSVHSIVAAAFIGQRPDGKQVNHKNGDKSDNRVENLEYVTPKENIQHAINNGMIQQNGEKNTQSRLTESDIRRIHRLRSEGVSITDIATKFNICYSHTCAIVNNRSWRHLT